MENTVEIPTDNKYELTEEQKVRCRSMFRPISAKTVKADVTPEDSEGWARECNPSLAKAY